MLLSSPPRRGCFPLYEGLSLFSYVFPASAGVFLKSPRRASPWCSLPRLGGGVSTGGHIVEDDRMSSPPRRGCFWPCRCPYNEHCVFPASAGVFPSFECGEIGVFGLPRLGGGVSPRYPPKVVPRESSPPRRGCFQSNVRATAIARVFPASAGVFLTSQLEHRYFFGLPRLGGGVSSKCPIPLISLRSSPPRRGCFSLGR